MSRRSQRDRPLTEAEAALWRQAVAGAAPLPGSNKRLPPPHRPPPRNPRLPDSHPPDPRPRLQGQAPPARSAERAPNKPIDRATMTRLKSGRMPIEGRIDLHGMTAAAAQRNLTTFLKASQAHGRRAVLVITGRGLDPQNLGRGVLKREAPHWLDAMPDIVAGYAEADRRHGGAGAYYVRIRRKDKAQSGAAPGGKKNA